MSGKVELSLQNLLVIIEGHISTDHVVQKDSQRPDGCPNGTVLTIANPLWRTINSSTCNNYISKVYRYTFSQKIVVKQT